MSLFERLNMKNKKKTIIVSGFDIVVVFYSPNTLFTTNNLYQHMIMVIRRLMTGQKALLLFRLFFDLLYLAEHHVGVTVITFDQGFTDRDAYR